MKILIYTIFLATLFLDPKDSEEWNYLLDENLSQWENYLSYSHVNGYNGKIPKDESGKDIVPIGYNKDNKKVFSILNEKGGLMLKVSGETYGCVYTKEEYSNYHFSVMVKWGEKKMVPRLEKLRDSGILYHSIGEAGVDYWRAWMLSQEFQIMEGHMGDYWNIANSAIEIRAFLPEGRMNSVANSQQRFLAFGSGASEGFCLRQEDHESPPSEWTKLELICFEDKSLHIVNGKVVMVLRNSHYVLDGKKHPLTKGRIQVQSEAAEVYFKDIKIRKLNTLPQEYTSLF